MRKEHFLSKNEIKKERKRRERKEKRRGKNRKFSVFFYLNEKK
jgi:hypothetical protein